MKQAPEAPLPPSAEQIAQWVRDALAGAAPPQQAPLLHAHTPDTAEAVRLLGFDTLRELSQAMVRGEHAALIPMAVGVLIQAAHNAMLQTQLDLATAFLTDLRVFAPNDLGVRLDLSRQMERLKQPESVVEVLEPVLGVFATLPPVYLERLAALLIAAVAIGDFGLAKKVRETVLAREDDGLLPASSQALADRLGFLFDHGLGVAHLEARRGDAAGQAYLAGLLATDEFAMIEALRSDALSGSPDLESPLLAARIAQRAGWTRPYRMALKLAADALALTGDVAVADTLWGRLHLPETAWQPLLIAARAQQYGALSGAMTIGTLTPIGRALEATGSRRPARSPEELYLEAFHAFHAAPSVATARVVWSTAYEAGRFSMVSRFAPLNASPVSVSERARAFDSAAAPVRPDAAPLWVMMTWRNDADRLLRLLAAYVDPGVRLVVSIGGDGRPEDLALASALLLVDGAHFLVRPTVTWGGQKLLFQNVLEVMDAFSATAPAEAWIQVICDRTYPAASIKTLRNELGLGPDYLRRFNHVLGPWGWSREWPDAVVADLPNLYRGALDEVFEAGRATRMVTLASELPLWGDRLHRLRASTFNFTDEPQVIGDRRSAAHHYSISAFDQDTRWMSFSRLHEFVDTSAENGATYARRMHPITQSWVHKTLSRFSLRNGDPFITANQNYVRFVQQDERIVDLFTAMNMSFGPEMNFFDTVTDTFDLHDTMKHIYCRIPDETANDPFLPSIVDSADTRGGYLVRKTDMQKGRETLRFLVERGFEDNASPDFHWISTSARDPAPREVLPRLDQALVTAFTDVEVVLRNLLGETARPAVFAADGVIRDPQGESLAQWSFDGAVLTVAYADEQLGEKRYARVAGDGRNLTLVPAEMVDVWNGWSQFIDIPLAALKQDPAVTSLGRDSLYEAYGSPRQWTGSRNLDSALLCAFTEADDQAFLAPVATGLGGVYEMRTIDGQDLALCAVDGDPVLLRLSGFAEADGRIAAIFSKAPQSLVERWDEAEAASTAPQLPRDAIAGRWRIDRLDGARVVTLDAEGRVLADDGAILGRWLLRSDGLQILGVEGMRHGLASQYRRHGGVWRLSGWAWKNLKDVVTFSMTQI